MRNATGDVQTKGLNTPRDSKGMRHGGRAQLGEITMRLGGKQNWEHETGTETGTKKLETMNKNEIKDY